MDLWVRSQDKMKLVKVNYCYIMNQTDHFTIIGETIDSGTIIATYKTKERALEVLDEIQNILNAFKRNAGKEGKYEYLDLGIKVNMLNYVYEMPKE